MKLDKAIEIVTEYQKWRTSKPPYNGIGVTYNVNPKELTQAIDTLIASVTITDEMVERTATALYIRDNAPHIPKSKRNDFILNHQPISVSIHYRRKAKSALTAALHGGGDE
jgi:hypothetical protein